MYVYTHRIHMDILDTYIHSMCFFRSRLHFYPRILESLEITGDDPQRFGWIFDGAFGTLKIEEIHRDSSHRIGVY